MVGPSALEALRRDVCNGSPSPIFRDEPPTDWSRALFNELEQLLYIAYESDLSWSAFEQFVSEEVLVSIPIILYVAPTKYTH